MNKYIYDVNKNDTINIWKYDEFKTKEYKVKPSIFENKEHYYNIGLTATKMEDVAEIIYPVREKFIKENFLEDVIYKKREYKNLYFPWENRRVEFSGFNYYPAIKSLNLQSFIEVDEDCSCEFELKVTGGIKIWVNGNLQVQYGKYKRNCGVKTKIKLNLLKGENEIVVYTNDLAERDTFYYFEMIYVGDKTLKSYVYLENTLQLQQKADSLKSMFFLSDEATPDNCKIGFDKEIVKVGFEFSISGVGMNTTKKFIVTEENFENGVIKIDDYFNENSLGGRKVKLICELEDCSIERELYVLIYTKENEKLKPALNILDRKKQAIDYLYKFNTSAISRIIPTLEKGNRLNEEEKEVLKTNLKIINDRLDCADFKLPIILLIKERYSKLLDDDMLAEIKNATINFRYWIDELGNDVMWFFSENHAFLFHVCQYISGLIYKNETFISGKSSNEQYEIGKQRVITWFEEFLQVGYDEWNSTTYLPVDFIGFFVLYEIAKDEEILKYAKKALDISFEIIASNVHRNTYATSYGRVYEKQLKSAKLAELSMISWIAYGYGYPNNRDHSTALFAISSYEPKSYTNLLNIAEKSITIERLQGRSKVYTYIHKRDKYSLASVIKFLPFTDGMQQHVFNLILGDENKNIITWINHPGERVFSGEHRPSYWAGNGSLPLIEQYKNVCLLSYKIDENKDVDYIHSYMPINNLCEYKKHNNWFFGRVNESFVGMYFNNSFELVQKGANTNKELISYGLENYVIVKCGSKKEHYSFENFMEKCKSTNLKITDNENFVYDDFEYGKIEVIKNRNLIINNVEELRNADKNGIVTYDN